MDLRFGQSDALFVDNPEPRCPCALLLDTSASMMGRPIEELSAGLLTYRDALLTDPLAAKRVEIAVFSFGRRATKVQDFGTVDDFSIPALKAAGETPMGACLELALDALRDRTSLYRANGVAYYRPWMLLLTDGAPTDEWRPAARRIREGEARKSLLFFAVAVEGGNVDALRSLSVREPVRLSGLRFGALFQWLSNSQKAVSRSSPGAEVPLQNPTGEGGWAESERGATAEGSGAMDVAVVVARCRTRREPFAIRVERRPAGWIATYSQPVDEEDAGAIAPRAVPSFSFADDYPGCPCCASKGLFKCGCGKAACWDGQKMRVVCPWCSSSGILGGTVESFDGSGG